jgi:hypothetical protein
MVGAAAGGKVQRSPKFLDDHYIWSARADPDVCFSEVVGKSIYLDIAYLNDQRIVCQIVTIDSEKNFDTRHTTHFDRFNLRWLPTSVSPTAPGKTLTST